MKLSAIRTIRFDKTVVDKKIDAKTMCPGTAKEVEAMSTVCGNAMQAAIRKTQYERILIEMKGC